MEFVQRMPIRFADVDAAGIVYYPRFFHYYHQVFEDFFGMAHGTPYPEWIRTRRLGFPTRHVESDFERPLRYGDDLQIALTVPRVGNTSIDFRFEARLGGSRAASAVIGKVCVDLDELHPTRVPDDLRGVVARYGAAP